MMHVGDAVFLTSPSHGKDTVGNKIKKTALTGTRTKKMKQITDADIRRVDAMLNQFRKAMIGKDKDAEAKFIRELSFSEQLKIGSAKLSYEFACHSNPRNRAEKMIVFCETALPALKRVFGEGALIAAVPKEAMDMELIGVCVQLGGNGIVDLLRKAMKKPKP
jgi:hypothetical protein